MGISVFPQPSTATIPTPVIGIPAGVSLRNTYTSTTGSLSFPVDMGYAIVIGGGGCGAIATSGNVAGGQAGGAVQGWIKSPTSVTIGAGGSSSGVSGNYSLAGDLIAGGGGGASGNAGRLGGPAAAGGSGARSWLNGYPGTGSSTNLAESVGTSGAAGVGTGGFGIYASSGGGCSNGNYSAGGSSSTYAGGAANGSGAGAGNGSGGGAGYLAAGQDASAGGAGGSGGGGGGTGNAGGAGGNGCV
jgi:hypothetical protein